LVPRQSGRCVVVDPFARSTSPVTTLIAAVAPDLAEALGGGATAAERRVQGG
jgi:hypothetical protein